VDRVKVATITVYLEDSSYSASYSDEVGSVGYSDDDLNEDKGQYLELAVASAIASVKKNVHDDSLLNFERTQHETKEEA